MCDQEKNTETLEIGVDKLAAGGDGIGRHQGKVWFIPGAFPGDRVCVLPSETRKNYSRGILLEVIEPSPQRREPFCPLAHQCGGCPWQALEEENQWRWKETLWREGVERLAGQTVLPDITGVYRSSPQGYRCRVQVHSQEGIYGFKERRGDSLVAVSHCPVLLDSLNRALKEPPVLPPGRWPLLGDHNTASWGVEGPSAQTRDMEVGDITLKAHPRGFFQSHLEGTAFLLDLLRHQVAGKGLVDLYSGVGLFSTALKDNFTRVTAVESVPLTADLARENGGDQVSVFTESVETFLKKKINPQKEDWWLLDPPRRGLSRRVIQFLQERVPPRLVYISCNPVTQARDWGLLNRYYRCTQAYLLDFYPHTPHMETVLFFEARRGYGE